ncbi:MAG TPA: hypothetical protein VIO34_07050 [Candidatus Dormibacteraeota bacterium]
MSPEAEQQAFRRLLEDEAAKDRSLLQPLARPAPVALQAIGLARVQFGRAKRELLGAMEAGDFDEPYLNSYRSLVSGCNALLAAYGYRVRGGDGSHFETLRLAALGLAVSSPKAGTLLETMREPVRSARNEAEYQRPGVTTAADLREILDAVSVILPAVVELVMRLTGGPLPVGADDWSIADLLDSLG